MYASNTTALSHPPINTRLNMYKTFSVGFAARRLLSWDKSVVACDLGYSLRPSAATHPTTLTHYCNHASPHQIHGPPTPQYFDLSLCSIANLPREVSTLCPISPQPFHFQTQNKKHNFSCDIKHKRQCLPPLLKLAKYKRLSHGRLTGHLRTQKRSRAWNMASKRGTQSSLMERVSGSVRLARSLCWSQTSRNSGTSR